MTATTAGRPAHALAADACYACGAARPASRTIAAPDPYRYLVCPSCGSGRLHPLPEHPEELYTKAYFVRGGAIAGYLDYEADARWHRLTARGRLRRLQALRPDPSTSAPPRLVDVGAATGFFLDVARDAGWQVHGVETSEWAAARARGRGHHVKAHLDDYPAGACCDAVTFFQVLEHLPDPVGQLRRAAERLRPGGVVLCETWDLGSATARVAGARWQQLSPPSVLWLFSRGGMDAMARRAGLRLVSWRRSSKTVGLSTVLGQALPLLNEGRNGRAVQQVTVRVGVPYVLDDLVTAALVKA